MENPAIFACRFCGPESVKYSPFFLLTAAKMAPCAGIRFAGDLRCGAGFAFALLFSWRNHV